MGEVYEAEHVLIHRRVAVKILQRNLASAPEALAPVPRPAERGRSKLSSFLARIATGPRAGEPFALDVSFAALRGSVHDASDDGTLEAEVSIAYFKDHAVGDGRDDCRSARTSTASPTDPVLREAC